MNNDWVSNKNAIINQIGTAEFELVKNNSDEEKWPNEFRERFDENGNDNSTERFKKIKNCTRLQHSQIWLMAENLTT